MSDVCQVKWNGSELLNATVVAMGSKADMDKKEELLKNMYEEEEEVEIQPPPAKKAKRI